MTNTGGNRRIGRRGGIQAVPSETRADEAIDLRVVESGVWMIGTAEIELWGIGEPGM